MKRNSAVRVGAIPASGAAIPEEVSNADQGPGGFFHGGSFRPRSGSPETAVAKLFNPRESWACLGGQGGRRVLGFCTAPHSQVGGAQV